MNILINTITLKNSLQDIIGVVGKDISTPILNHVLIEKNDSEICLTTSNLEVQISANVQYIESDDFEPITVPGRKFFEIIRSLEDQDIKINTKNNKIIIKTKNSSFKLSTLPANNFPTFEELKTIESFSINQKNLLDLLNKTSFSMASNPDVRFILCGLLLEISPNNLTAVATDAHRLAISSSALEKKQINNISCIVPRKAVLELIRVLSGNTDTKVSIGNNQIKAEFKGIKFISKLMDGKFPAGYKGVIPSSATIEVLLQKQNIRAALQRVSILANEKFKGVRFEATSDEIVLSSENPEQEEARETLQHKASAPQNDKIIAGFNAGYLIEAINACSGDEIVIGLNGPKEKQETPTESKAKTEGTLIYSTSDNNTKYVVMPYNI